MRIDARGNDLDGDDNIVHLAPPRRVFDGIIGHDGKPLDTAATPDLVRAMALCLDVMKRTWPELPPAGSVELRRTRHLPRQETRPRCTRQSQIGVAVNPHPTLALTIKANEVLVVGEARITMRHRRGKYHIRVTAPKSVRITREKQESDHAAIYRG